MKNSAKLAVIATAISLATIFSNCGHREATTQPSTEAGADSSTVLKTVNQPNWDSIPNFDPNSLRHM